LRIKKEAANGKANKQRTGCRMDRTTGYAKKGGTIRKTTNVEGRGIRTTCGATRGVSEKGVKGKTQGKLFTGRLFLDLIEKDMGRSSVREWERAKGGRKKEEEVDLSERVGVRVYNKRGTGGGYIGVVIKWGAQDAHRQRKKAQKAVAFRYLSRGRNHGEVKEKKTIKKE